MKTESLLERGLTISTKKSVYVIEKTYHILRNKTALYDVNGNLKTHHSLPFLQKLLHFPSLLPEE